FHIMLITSSSRFAMRSLIAWLFAYGLALNAPAWSHYDDVEFEKIDRTKIESKDDGTYIYEGKKVGCPNDSLFWREWLKKKKVEIHGPEHRNLCEFVAVKLQNGKLFLAAGGEGIDYPRTLSRLVDLQEWSRRKGYASPMQPKVRSGAKPLYER